MINMVQGLTGETPLYVVMDRLLKNARKEDFIFTKKYRVRSLFKKARGKWPGSLTDSIFIDSKKFLVVYAEML